MSWFHFHKWVEVNRQYGEVSEYTPPILGAKYIGTSLMTMITMKCECGEYKQQTLDGEVRE